MTRVPLQFSRHFFVHVVAAILFVALGSSAAHSQDTAHFAIRLIPESPATHFGGNVCLLPSGEMCSGLVSADPHSTFARSSDGTFKKTLKRFEADQAGIYSAPFHRSNLKWDALFLVGTGVLIGTDRYTSGEVSKNHLKINRDISNAGFYGTFAVAGAFLLSGVATHNEHARETGVLSVEALVNSFPVYAGMQFIAGRERPNEGTGNGRFLRNNALSSSFPSGHALFTWSIASVIAHEYPRPWVKWLAYGTATIVSVERFTGREHFPSDVMVGSALGYLIGRHVFQAHCKLGFSESCHARKIDPSD
jgi:membrane-associated phospholipid phosphatase